MRIVASIVLTLLLSVAPSWLAASEDVPWWLQVALREGGARPADIEDVNATFLNEQLRREIRSQSRFCAMRLRPLTRVVAADEAEQYSGNERFHGAVVVSERECRDPGVAIGITQMLTDPDRYHVVLPPGLVSLCECESDYEVGFEFDTSAGRFDVVILTGFRGIVTYWDGFEIGGLSIAKTSDVERFRVAVLSFLEGRGD